LFENAIDRKRLNKIVGICKLNKILKKSINGKLIFESGRNLSGGQNQRIALARTLYLDRQIILLDESISNVEKKLEREIMLNIKKYAKAKLKTVIVITHSNHYLDLADEVYQLNQGKMKIKNDIRVQ
jgi:ABC-type bacteriocin/lantibiotic exporter with double-glycine peptidase domain